MVFGHGFNSRRLHQIWKRTPRVSFFIFYEPRIEPARASQNTKNTTKVQNLLLLKKQHQRANRGQITDSPLSVESLAGRGRFPSFVTLSQKVPCAPLFSVCRSLGIDPLAQATHLKHHKTLNSAFTKRGAPTRESGTNH